jgi:dTDP-glucose 4,6-dehydratase
MNVLVTGGCGFIGSNFVRYLRTHRAQWRVANLDKLTYAGNLENLRDLEADPGLRFIHGDINDRATVERVLREEKIDAIVHLAAESHVDRSILGPGEFIITNVLGTAVLLDAAREHRVSRFVMVSTDEVYGSLGASGAFVETSPLHPSSPYAASKASADLLTLAYGRTYGLDVVVTRCSNNYGPFQFPEKLIPLMINNALNDQPLPVYGDGRQVRDWLHVDDHCAALLLILEKGRAQSVYNIGGGAERDNLSVVTSILTMLGKPRSLIRHVADRPAHDRRYATDASKLRDELGWIPTRPFEQGLIETVRWYTEHRSWCERVTSGEYRHYYETQYRSRLES